MKSSRIKQAIFATVAATPLLAFPGQPPKSLVYDEVEVVGAQSAGMQIVEAIHAGNVKIVDQILDQGLVGIDDPICVSSDGRTGLLRTAEKNWDLDPSNAAETLNDVVNPAGNPVKMPVLFPHPVLSSPTWHSRFEMPAAGTWGVGTPMPMQTTYYLHGTPLMVAARAGNSFMVKHLLGRGANPNVFVSVGETSNLPYGSLRDQRGFVHRPWLFALEEGYRIAGAARKSRQKMDDIAQLLIKAGAVLPPEDALGRNGLWDAAIAQSVPMLELALASGLDVDSEDNTGTCVGECDLFVTGTDNAIFWQKLRGASKKQRGGKPVPHSFDDNPAPAPVPVPSPAPGPALGPFPSPAPGPNPAPVRTPCAVCSGTGKKVFNNGPDYSGTMKVCPDCGARVTSSHYHGICNVCGGKGYIQ